MVPSPSMDADLCEALVAHEVVLGEEWTDGRHRLGVVCVTEGDEGLEQRLQTPGPRQRVSRKLATQRLICHSRVGLNHHSW